MPVFETKTIEEITETLIDYRGKTPPKTFEGIKLITAKVIKDGRIINDNHEYILEETYSTWMRRGFPKQWDILITTEAPLGEVAQLRTCERIALAQRVILLRGNANIIDQGYYFQALKSDFVKAELSARATGTTVLGIKQSELKKVRIPYYPLPTQKKIASILSAYDDLIENNIRRIKILEEMAQTLYHEWFVKFRFPGHEQTKMVDSELGLIPEGWEVKSLGQILDIKHGYAFKGEYFSKEPTHNILLTPGNFSIGGGFKDDKFKYYNGPLPIEYILNPGDLLITMTDLSKVGDTLGYPAFVPPSKEFRFLHNQRLGKVTINTEKFIGLNFLYYIFCSNSYRHHVLATATGATVKHTAPDRIKAFKIALPSKESCVQFKKITENFQHQIICLKQKNINLRKTRDLLLPKLISGEIDVEHLDITTEDIAA